MIENRDLILNLRQTRTTYEDIGALLGITKQRVQQICKKLGIQKASLPAKETYFQKKKKLLLENYIVNPSTECWEWVRSRTPTGYGSFSYLGKRAYAHRVAYSLLVDPEFNVFQGGRNDSSSTHVYHSCDNPSCINPEHLWLGTPEDNMRDRDLKAKTRSRDSKKN